MPVTIDWGNEKKTISHMKFVKPWIWDEFYITYKTGYQMTESVTHMVNIVMDFTQSDGRLPPSALTHFRKAATKAHPRRGIVVIVSQRIMLVKTLVGVIQKITRPATPLHFTNSVEEAYSLIAYIVGEEPETVRSI